MEWNRHQIVWIRFRVGRMQTMPGEQKLAHLTFSQMVEMPQSACKIKQRSIAHGTPAHIHLHICWHLDMVIFTLAGTLP